MADTSIHACSSMCLAMRLNKVRYVILLGADFLVRLFAY